MPQFLAIPTNRLPVRRVLSQEPISLLAVFNSFHDLSASGIAFLMAKNFSKRLRPLKRLISRAKIGGNKSFRSIAKGESR